MSLLDTAHRVHRGGNHLCGHPRRSRGRQGADPKGEAPRQGGPLRERAQVKFLNTSSKIFIMAP